VFIDCGLYFQIRRAARSYPDILSELFFGPSEPDEGGAGLAIARKADLLRKEYGSGRQI
jgi:hypothetical protein